MGVFASVLELFSWYEERRRGGGVRKNSYRMIFGNKLRLYSYGMNPVIMENCLYGSQARVEVHALLN